VSDTANTTNSDDTLKDAYAYVLAIVNGNTSDVIAVQAKYKNKQVRDLMGASAGVLLGVFGKTSDTFRAKVAAGLQYGITGDKSYLDDIAADDIPAGNYL
jgi:hypothetical protein